MNLLDRVTDSENLVLAYRKCVRGKRESSGYYKTLFALGERLMTVQKLLKSNKYVWSDYREFYVTDPKRRLVMAAPFMDRVVHHAIHRQIEPIIDPYFSDSVFACRYDKGNRAAVLALYAYLKEIGPNRFVMKLDVEKCYESINLKILHRKITSVLPDNSIDFLLWSLIHNHPEYCKRGYGIPIGNLTSQLFANFYLESADQVVRNILTKGKLFRYMDDLVIVSPDKEEVMRAAWAAVEHVQKELRMDIPYTKMVPLGNASVPFLGFVVDHNSYRILARNSRRHQKRLLRLNKMNARSSLVAQVKQSFEAWRTLPISETV